ncbi:SGNH/GDSL hydrolase family protein [Cryobacterium melibiosiphilum]|uniref:SGNH/GDSL hydrolase family protein n=1 Tax=Cryobacterium melibiosiphilum TaxID=995039 RepID=A0A3A5MK86_9MICO|nr:SGNH/GDSL hydrolase family protein [Cryobacterium melibiosiphilum]RJT84662.1 SGNH/GDSL hydrolase family protein [Cryobacterium melibiosiphilum]
MRSTRHRVILGIAALGVVGAVALTIANLSPAPTSPTAAQFPDGPTVAFYGDSYTLGTGASDPALRWSTLISVPRGWNEVNPSVNGLGFVNNRSSLPGQDLVEQVIDADPDIVIVTMGLNDNFSMPAAADEIQAAIRDDLGALARSLPEARIVVVEPFWYTDARPESVDQISGWAQAGAQAIDADFIAGASRWIEGHPEWIGSDGLHPSDAGYAEIARRMDAELVLLGL